MLSEVRVPIGPEDTTTEVESILAVRGAELLVSTLDELEQGRVREVAQNDAQATYAPKLTKGEGLIEWARPAASIHNLVRGLWPWPHAFTYLSGQRYIVHRSRISAYSGTAAPGTIEVASAAEGLHVACGGDSAIELIDIQLEGKRVMKAHDAMAARTLTVGARFASS
jgi:methionyl-tRNA formyltransferase